MSIDRFESRFKNRSDLMDQITPSKVSGAALTSLASIPSGAGVVPTANLPTFTGIPGNIQVFTSNGTWTKPAGISTVYALISL